VEAAEFPAGRAIELTAPDEHAAVVTAQMAIRAEIVTALVDGACR
jgi:hypothetical protein